jgi:hypothetical protein
MTNAQTQTTDPIQDAISQALSAAALATDAAHEAEAAIAARNEAAQSMARVARRATWATGLAGGGAVLVLALGGLVWMRNSADLRLAADVQAAASAAFVERIADMNRALDRMDLSITAQEAETRNLETRITALMLDMQTELLRQTREQIAAQPSANEPLTPQIERLSEQIIAAITASEMNIAERIMRLPTPAPTPVATAQTPRTEARSTPRPAARPAAAPAPNPFRFP